MGFAHPAFNNIGKCKTKLNAKQQRAKEEHEKWLRKQGLHTEQLAARKPNKGIRLQDNEVRSQPKHKTSDKVGNGFVKETNTYTGTLITGIATLHKSNSVPVINKSQIEEISRMRR